MFDSWQNLARLTLSIYELKGGSMLDLRLQELMIVRLFCYLNDMKIAHLEIGLFSLIKENQV
jgi:hypothetical protein